MLRRIRGLWFLMTLWLAACGGVAAPTPPPSPTPIPPALLEAAAEFCPLARGWVVYFTQPGDTRRSLAERTSSSIAELATANCLNNPRGILLSGQVFYLPRPPITP